MAGSDSHERVDAQRSSIRTRAVVLSVLPVLFLGVTYFLQVEFFLRPSPEEAGIPPLLRYGGAAIALLFAVAAFGCGFYIADQFRRPFHAMLRSIDGGGHDPGAESPHEPMLSDPDVRRLLARVGNLIQQNRAGIQALRELESLQREATEITTSLRRAEERREIPVTLAASGSTMCVELERFVGILREEMWGIEGGLERLAGLIGRKEILDTSVATETEMSFAHLERIATVWSLRIERARRNLPDLPGELGSCFREFSAALERLRESTRANGRGGPLLVDDARSEIVGIRETIAGWLRNEKGATQ